MLYNLYTAFSVLNQNSISKSIIIMKIQHSSVYLMLQYSVVFIKYKRFQRENHVAVKPTNTQCLSNFG